MIGGALLKEPIPPPGLERTPNTFGVPNGFG